MDIPGPATQPDPTPNAAAPIVKPQDMSQKAPRPKSSGATSLPIVPIIIVVVIVVAGAGFFYFHSSIIKPPTTTSTSTIGQIGVSQINNCGKISSPGKYFLADNIKATLTSGACINVTASDVSVLCDNYKITGSGPFEAVPPYSYAIEIEGQNNVTVSGCSLRNFSYGIFAVSSNNLNINNNNLSINYMANIYLNNTHSSVLGNNYLSRSASKQGSLFMTNGTSSVSVLNNTIQYNQFYGINVNASDNKFINNYINGTQFSFQCSVPNGFVISSQASLNTCYNNTGCGFVVCRGTNLPANITKLNLGRTITTCGSITSPGSYSLASNLDMNQFVNISNIFSQLQPCITVTSKNVNINCRGFSINNATTAVSAKNVQNITLQNCRINNASSTGILLFNITTSHFANLSLNNDDYSIAAYNTSVSTFTNISSYKSLYGVLITGSFANVFQNLNASYDNYGVYLQDDSFSNTFNKGIMQNNSKIDVYATPDSANASINLMQSTACGSTNAVWATCKRFIATSLSYVPLNGCSVISSPGNYILTKGINNAQGNCIRVISSNVQLSCAGRIISAGFVSGPGMSITNSNNVSVNSCTFFDFQTAVNVTNSSDINLNTVWAFGNLPGNPNYYGIIFNRVNGSTIFNSVVNGTSNASILFNRVFTSSIKDSNTTYGILHNIGILLNNSRNDLIANNIATQNYIGFELVGKSTNNTVLNNTMRSSTNIDYVCIGNSAINSEEGGINFGTTKQGCHWLAVIPPTPPTVQCGVASQPNLFLLTTDERYTFGSTCFTSFANTTTINCAGHTVIATNGGTFAYFKNSQNSNIENCYLKGFNGTLVAVNSTIKIINNTIFENTSSPAAINVSEARLGAYVQGNNVTTPNRGIVMISVGAGSLSNNLVHLAKLAYTALNVSSLTIYNNTAYSDTYNGMLLNNSISNIFQNNNFLSSNTGISCFIRSQASINNTDLGQNACKFDLNCFWIKSSAGSCP